MKTAEEVAAACKAEIKAYAKAYEKFEKAATALREAVERNWGDLSPADLINLAPMIPDCVMRAFIRDRARGRAGEYERLCVVCYKNAVPGGIVNTCDACRHSASSMEDDD